MFYVGQIVRCSDDRVNAHSISVGLVRGPRHPKLSYYQRFEVARVKNWSDGSQSLFVVARPKSQKTNRQPPDPGERGPFSSLRFTIDPESIPTKMFHYDPSQLGDLDEGI